MTPNVSRSYAQRQLAPFSSLNDLLIFPISESAPQPSSFWKGFLNDLSFLLPTFGAGLGLLLLMNQVPFVGAALLILCPIILALRIHSVCKARREHQRLAEFSRWYRKHRDESDEQRQQEMTESPTILYIPIPPLR